MAYGFGYGYGGSGGRYADGYSSHRNPHSLHQDHGYRLEQVSSAVDDDGAPIRALSVEEVKADRRFDSDAEDGIIARLIDVATEWCENATGRALIHSTWDMRLDSFPAVIHIPKPPIFTVVSITYRDYSSNLQLLPSEEYQVDNPGQRRSGRIVPAVNGRHWPWTRSDVVDAVRVRFEAGYGRTPSDVPASLRQAMLLYIGELFERREDGSAVVIHDVPHSSKSLIERYRVWQGGV